MQGVWFALAIADWPGLEKLHIPHLELLAAGIGLLTYADMLSGAEAMQLDTDALATAIALTERAKSPGMQVILDALLDRPVYQRMTPKLEICQIWGATNILSDAASRGYVD